MRLLELYASVQGEGPNVGKPTTFVRFAGCNMRCPGWPCDTPYSIDPKIWRHKFKEVHWQELINRLKADKTFPRHMCITGGEPLLQKDMNVFIGNSALTGYTGIDIFTNGSLDLTPVLFSHVTIIMDWKLKGSGEGDSYLEQRHANLGLLRHSDAVKFVVKDRNDLIEMKAFVENVKFKARPYVSPAWGVIEPKEIVEFLQDYGLDNVFLNLQTHKYIWDPMARRI